MTASYKDISLNKDSVTESETKQQWHCSRQWPDLWRELLLTPAIFLNSGTQITLYWKAAVTMSVTTWQLMMMMKM